MDESHLPLLKPGPEPLMAPNRHSRQGPFILLFPVSHQTYTCLTIYEVAWIPSSNLGTEVLKGHMTFSKNITSTLNISHSLFIILSGESDLEKSPLQCLVWFSAVLVLTVGLGQAAKITAWV